MIQFHTKSYYAKQEHRLREKKSQGELHKAATFKEEDFKKK